MKWLFTGDRLREDAAETLSARKSIGIRKRARSSRNIDIVESENRTRHSMLPATSLIEPARAMLLAAQKGNWFGSPIGYALRRDASVEVCDFGSLPYVADYQLAMKCRRAASNALSRGKYRRLRDERAAILQNAIGKPAGGDPKRLDALAGGGAIPGIDRRSDRVRTPGSPNRNRDGRNDFRPRDALLYRWRLFGSNELSRDRVAVRQKASPSAAKVTLMRVAILSPKSGPGSIAKLQWVRV